MPLEKRDIFEILTNSLSEESKWFLFALSTEKVPLHKENLRDVANELFKRVNAHDKKKQLITSRHSLDIHTARLEGAGLVNVQRIGQIRIYSLTELGTELLNYLTNKQTN
ncbi:hypothetical protein [Psychrobacillus sp. MER TA 171]|uniref:hypothetical protein n=1 Tax=Psychrobacillus sp. MER TA 171 TaxID=2939577 RepID=UPI00204001B4|nr:hypothetical protein [Psychrobacillus sp. MER TA 171]MCM3358171.1 hypothetical protein [Psychrobacillus sp. MER TA 171]